MSHPFLRTSLFFCAVAALSTALAVACSSSSNNTGGAGAGSGSGAGSSTQTGNGGSTGVFTSGTGTNSGNPIGSTTGGDACPLSCSTDDHTVVDCHGNVNLTCSGMNGCDPQNLDCSNACDVSVKTKTSVGCEFYATNMDNTYANLCFAAFVANTWNTPVHIQVAFEGTQYPQPQDFIRIPSGSGTSVTYSAYDPTNGLPPGQVAIVFLSGTDSTSSTVPCPAPTASMAGSMIWNRTGTGNSFQITTDVPVVAYQINPYGGAVADVTGASLLLPTSVWGTNYIAVTAMTAQTDTFNGGSISYAPSINIVAASDNTTVTILPTAAIAGGNPLPAGPANTPYKFTLSAGQQAQFTQSADLAGSIITSSSPVGLMGGHQCMQIPAGTSACDHGEQMIPPVTALGNEYVGVMWRPRTGGDEAIWHLVGTVNGTNLTYSPSTPTGAPPTLSAGQVVEFNSADPFIVQSQDTMHPFMLFAKMSSADWSQLAVPGYGDPDFVIGVPPQQYLNNYAFFTDVTYPETNLVVIRAPDANNGGAFDDVTLDCLSGPLTGWQAIGPYQWTRVDVQTGFNAVNGCSNGAHSMTSKGLFGLWVWGWGSPMTVPSTSFVSYGYPGGMNVAPINGVYIPPTAT